MPNDVKSANAASDCGVEHFKLEGTTVGNVELGIVIPAVNEEVTVWEFIDCSCSFSSISIKPK